MTRAALLLLAVLVVSQGCMTLSISAISADTNRARKAEATGSASDLAEEPPAVGDTLDVWLADGTRLRGAFVGMADSLRLGQPEGVVALDLAGVERVQRPWKRENLNQAAFIGIVVDMAIFMYLMHDFTMDFSGFGRGSF